MPKQKGFTLIELLVVIAIIGLLASVVLVSLNGARVKARNARRTADIRQVITAISMALNAGATLPDNAGGLVCLSTTCTGWLSVDNNNNLIRDFISPYVKIPAVPPGVNIRYNGYVYSNPSGGWNWVEGGDLAPVGPYLFWQLELPYSTGMCSPGRYAGSGSDYADCRLLLNQ